MKNITKPSKISTIPLWQWMAICGISAVIIYEIVYYSFFYTWVRPVSNTISTTANLITPTPTPIIISRQDSVKGSFFVGSNNMTLYTFDRDTAGVSNCDTVCVALWPPYSASESTDSTALPENLSVIKRSDGSLQYAYKDHPLYFYVKDQKPGDIFGDNFNYIWHLVQP